MMNNSVDKIVKGLNKTIEKLRTLTDKMYSEVGVASSKMQALSDHCDNCRNEAERASRIANKLSELVE